MAQSFIKSEDVLKDYVKAWFVQHPAALAAWRTENKDSPDPAPEDLAVAFFKSFAEVHPATWLVVEKTEHRDKDGSTIKGLRIIRPGDADSGDIAAVLFDAWRQQHAGIELTTVPGDLVMASASGLDPHITLENAQFQLDRVAGTWGKITRRSANRIRGEIEIILRQAKFAPLGGLAGVDLINVLDVNLALKERFAAQVSNGG
jgi:potassium-transporting ATPase KdpC subunit